MRFIRIRSLTGSENNHVQIIVVFYSAAIGT